MRHTKFGRMNRPIVCHLEHAGDRWSMLILRDAFAGLTRFDQFQRNLGVAPNILARRLTALVGAGLLEKRRYSESTPRHEYVLTTCGRDFRPVLVALQVWGNAHFAPEGKNVVTIDERTGMEVQPIVIDRLTGLALSDPAFRSVPGPAIPNRKRQEVGKTPGRQGAEA